MKKAIFIDLDGTLLNDRKEISARTVEIINKIKIIGYEPIICTGRSINRAEKFYKAIDCKYLIYSTGGGIFDCQAQKIIYENSILKNDILSLIKITDYNNVNVVFISGNTRYLTKSERFNDVGLMSKTDIKDIIIENSIEKFLLSNKVLQITVASPDYHTMKILKPVIESEISDKPLELAIIGQSKSLSDDRFPREPVTYYDFVNKYTSKGNGIIKFCEIFGISKKNRIAIGDDINDISMYEVCGFNVAMGNALTEIKKNADFITDDNNNDGVAKFLETLL